MRSVSNFFLRSAVFGHSVHSADNMEPPLDVLRPSGLLLMYKSMNYNTFHVTFMYVYKCMSIRGLVPTLQYNYTCEVKR